MEEAVRGLIGEMRYKAMGDSMRSKWMSVVLLCAAVVSMTTVLQRMAEAQKKFPLPTAAQQERIDTDTLRRHIGDSPADPGPLATDLSPRLTPTAIDAASRKVADWELANWQPWFDQAWTSSVLYTGMMAESESTGDAKYRLAMEEVARKYADSLKDRLPNADAQSIGQMYVELYLVGGKQDKALIGPTQADLDSVIGLDTLKPGDPRIPWWWCDALFMAPPLWARMYAATGDRKYVDYLDQQWARTSDLLYDKDEHLYARDESFKSKLGPNGKKIFWSRGEGWVMAGIARTLPYLPADDTRRGFYTQQLQEMAARIAKLQDSDGLWHASLLDSKDYPLPEVSGSALMTFAMAWGVNHGVLKAGTYRPVIEKAWRGMLQHIYADGRLGCIQQTGAEPALYLPGSSFDYGVGGFLLAAEEVKRMETGKMRITPGK
jgi:unsaturated rhamnogalacturonyl hydrolase